MHNVRPGLKKLLIAALVIYVAGITVILSDLYYRVIKLEHELMHAGAGHDHK